MWRQKSELQKKFHQISSKCTWPVESIRDMRFTGARLRCMTNCFCFASPEVSEHETPSLPGRLAPADRLPVGDHVESHCQFPEYGHHVPIKFCAALDVWRSPGLLHQVTNLFPVTDLTDFRLVMLISRPSPVRQSTVQADQGWNCKDVATSGYCQVVPGFRGGSWDQYCKTILLCLHGIVNYGKVLP